MMTKNNIRLFLISGFILLSSLVLGYLLSISSFEDFYKNSLISRYKIANEEIKNSIEASVNFGKPIDNFSGMDQLLTSIVKNEEGIENVFVALPEGKILYSYNKSYLDKVLTDNLIPQYNDSEKKDIFLMGNKYYIVSPIYYKNLDIVGNTYIEFNKHEITGKTKLIIKESLRLFLAVSVICILLLFLVIAFIDFHCRKNKTGGKMITTANFVMIIIFLVASNCIYSYLNTISYKEKYLKIIDTNVDYFSKSVKNEIEFFLDLGLKIDRLNKIEEVLYKKLKEIPECKRITVINNKAEILYSVDQDKNKVSKYFENYVLKKLDFNRIDMQYNKIVVLNDKENNSQGKVMLTLNNQYINKKILDLFLDSLTVVLVSIVVCFMMLLMVSLFSDKKENETIQEENDKNLKTVQIASFIFYFGELISLSFIPILTNKLFLMNPVSLMGLSKETMISLPISAYMLGAAIFVLLIGFISDRYSEKKIFIFCSLLLITGAVGAAMSTSIAVFIVFRFISGLGYGGISINSTNYILKNTEESKIASGFGYWTAGYAAASICAIPIGGVIVYRFGYMNALLVSAVFAVLFLIFVIKIIKTKKDDTEKIIVKRERVNLYDLIGIFKDRNVVANMLCTIIPFQLVYVGVFQYLMPLYMNKEGMSQANIGRILTIFGVVYLLVPLVSRYVDKVKNDKLFIGMGNLIIGLSLLLFNISNSFIIIIIIIIGLSIGSMMGDAAEESFVTSTKKAKEIGGAKLMGIYSTYERIVMIFAPLITGAMIAFAGYNKSVFTIGVITIVASIVFTAVSENRREGEKVNE